MKKIIFHENSLTERGTSVAVYDYAFYARQYLDLHPIVCFNAYNNSHQSAVDKFSAQFETYYYESFNEVQLLVDSVGAEYFYAIKYGEPDGIMVQNAKNLIHSVFAYDPGFAHGDVYAVVSEWQSIRSGHSFPAVPHMVDLPDTEEDMRIQLGIPKDALVIGRHGSPDTFNIPFAVESIKELLEKRKDVWVVFLNTERKIIHPRCIYLNAIIDIKEKTKYINTCDVMLHARNYGETFGLSVLEFAVKNKQIISYDNPIFQNNHYLGGRNHFLYLGNNCHRYKNKKELDYILENLERKNPFDTTYLMDQFSPKAVIETFNKVFIV
jgi:hypothetical protein